MTFTDWLLTQKHRDDPVGDLARDAAQDPTWPKEETLDSHIDHMESRGACAGAIEALAQTWDKYEQVKKGVGEPEPWP